MAILKKGNILGVCVHHSVYKPANNLAELKAQATLFNGWHSKKEWAELTKTPSAYPYISYHYLMATNGEMLKVTDEKYVKYHSGDNFRKDLSFNLHGIAVCLTGNYENDKPTDAQMKALVLFIRDVEKRYKINARVRGHKETSQTATACPGRNIGTSQSGWLKQVITNTNDKNYPPVVKPPEPPEPPGPTECEKEVDRLKDELLSLESFTEALEAEKESLITQNVELYGDISSLEQEIIELKAEMADLQQKLDTLRIKFDNSERERIDLVKQLAECKESSESQMASSFKLFVEELLQKLGLLKK